MSVTLTFHTIKEKKPQHEQNIIVLKPFRAFGSYGFDPIESIVDYVWEELDEKGQETGCSVCYDLNEPQPENTILMMMIGNTYLEDDFLWMDVENYWNCFDQQEEIK